MISIDAKQKRQLYLFLTVFFLALGFWKVYRGKPVLPIVYFALGATTLALEFVFKAMGWTVFKGWMVFANWLGKINTVILLTIIYFLVLTPVGVLRRQRTKKSVYGPDACRKKQSAWFDLSEAKSTLENYSSSY